MWGQSKENHVYIGKHLLRYSSQVALHQIKSFSPLHRIFPTKSKIKFVKVMASGGQLGAQMEKPFLNMFI
jgi:hypothetical protein